jgi:hypothetical protein
MTGTHGSEGAPARKRAGATRLGDGVLGGAAGEAGHRLGLLYLFLVRGQQLVDHRGHRVDVGADPVDALQHGLEQRGVGGGEELGALQGFFQPGDLAAGGAAGQGGQHPGVAFPGDQVVHDVPAGDPVQVGEHAGQLDRGRFQQLLRALLVPGALAGQVPPVPGVQPDQPELLGGHETRGDRAALEARRQPPGIRRVPLGPPGQVLDLPGIGQHALEPLGLQPVERALPVVPGRLHHHRGHLPGPAPVRQLQHPPLRGRETAGLGRPPRRIGIRGHPDRRHHGRLADIDAAHPVPVQRLVPHLIHVLLLPPASAGC